LSTIPSQGMLVCLRTFFAMFRNNLLKIRLSFVRLSKNVCTKTTQHVQLFMTFTTANNWLNILTVWQSRFSCHLYAGKWRKVSVIFSFLKNSHVFEVANEEGFSSFEFSNVITNISVTVALRCDKLHWFYHYWNFKAHIETLSCYYYIALILSCIFQSSIIWKLLKLEQLSINCSG